MVMMPAAHRRFLFARLYLPERMFFGVFMDKKCKILFLCTGNSCRSQMAEGFARTLAFDAIEPYSAGVEPHGLNARAVEVMKESGIDISGHQSKHVDSLVHIPFDYVITVCDHAHETCPMFPGKTKIVHIGFDDPPALARSARTDEEALAVYRRVRDEIRAWILTLPGSLESAPSNQHTGPTP
jgi:arsenate reductase